MLDMILLNNDYVICDIIKTNPFEYNNHSSDHDSFTLNILKPLNKSSIDNNNNIDNNINNQKFFNYANADMASLKLELTNID